MVSPQDKPLKKQTISCIAIMQRGEENQDYKEEISEMPP